MEARAGTPHCKLCFGRKQEEVPAIPGSAWCLEHTERMIARLELIVKEAGRSQSGAPMTVRLDVVKYSLTKLLAAKLGYTGQKMEEAGVALGLTN